MSLRYSPNRNRLHHKSQLDIARMYPALQKRLLDRFHRNRSRLSFLFERRQTLLDIPGSLSRQYMGNHLDLLGLQKNQGNILHRCLRRLAPSPYNKAPTIRMQSIRLHERGNRSSLYIVYSLFGQNFLGNILGGSCCKIFGHRWRTLQMSQVYIHHILTTLQSAAGILQDSLRK